MHAQRGEAAGFIARAMAYTGDECLLWPFATLTSGYPMSKHGTVHAMVCEQEHGPRPLGAEAAHSCGNKLCVTRKHVSWKTRAGNEADKLIHGRSNRGERHGNGRLTREIVFAIRRSCGTNKEIAAVYGISQSYVSQLRNHQRWAWL